MSLFLCPRWRNKTDLFIYLFIILLTPFFNLSEFIAYYMVLIFKHNQYTFSIFQPFMQSTVRPLVSTHETASWRHAWDCHGASEAQTRPIVDHRTKPRDCNNNGSLILKIKQISCGAGINCCDTPHRIPGCIHIPSLTPARSDPHSPLHEHIPWSPCTTITSHITYNNWM